MYIGSIRQSLHGVIGSVNRLTPKKRQMLKLARKIRDRNVLQMPLLKPGFGIIGGMSILVKKD